jgi:hypothetical protein
MKIKILIVFFLVFFLWNNRVIAGLPIPADVKKTVCFIYVDKGKGRPEPNGTGFFLITQKPDKSYIHGYLVTAKHVLKPAPDKPEYYPEIYIRLTKKSGGVEGLKIPIRLNKPNKTLYTHKDSTVDIAVLPILPKLDRYDYKAISLEQFVERTEFSKLNIGEGSDVFFAGMFTPYLGHDKNYPIVRFGRIALISDEKIKFMDMMCDLILMDTFSFGGNSGSPVFVYLGAERKPGVLSLGPPMLKFVGIMSGTYKQGMPVIEVQTDTKELAFDNMGIAAVVPCEHLKNIILSKELKAIREY